MKMYEVYNGGPLHGFCIEIGPNEVQRGIRVHSTITADGTIRDVRYDRSERAWRDHPDHGPEYVIMDFHGPTDIAPNPFVELHPIRPSGQLAADEEMTEADRAVAAALGGADDEDEEDDGDPLTAGG